MRIILLTLTVFIMGLSPSYAGNITGEMAEKYQKDCVSKERPQNLSKKSHEFLCACTASKMLESMTTEDVMDLSSTDNTIARSALNYMLVNVYAPCMEHPTRDHYYHTCKSNPNTRLITTDPRVMCNCVAEKVGTYIAHNGPDIFEDILTRNPNIQDPMAALESDPKFQDYVKKQGVACLL